jgi:hypothetical protein
MAASHSPLNMAQFSSYSEKQLQFIHKNKIFSLLYVLAVLVTLMAAYKLGFREAAHQIAGQPERLRDITFYIWDNYPLSRHGYLVFYSLDDFNKNIAYSNHSTAYLFYMYVLYKIEMLIPGLQMRLVNAVLNMISLAGVVFYIISKTTKKVISSLKGFLTLLAVIFMVSMPGYWISAARFNVDNVFPLVFCIQTMISFFIWQDQENRKEVWILILLYSVFFPLPGVIFGMALLLYSLRHGGLDTKLFNLAIGAVLTGCIFYLQAPTISKILGFTSSNSGWLLRAGLDGDRTYFSNAVMAVVSPYFPRPLHIIAVPILLLVLQVVYSRAVTPITTPADRTHSEVSIAAGAGVFYFLICSQYLFTWLLWPQAIAIHPYLYDFLFLAPISLSIILNFLKFPEHFCLARLWILGLLFLISFNFQQIAQAKCNGCYYPAWSAGVGNFTRN